MRALFSKKWVKIVLLTFAVLFIAIQFVPVQKENPPVTVTVKWDSQRTKELFDRGCADCHSNETKWPWYTHVAPASWLVSADVIKGRKHLNISEDTDIDGQDLIDEIKSGEMPFKPYLIMHGEARFTDAEKTELIKGLEKTFAAEE